MLLQKLADKNLIHPPKFLIDNTHFLVRMGSYAYGTTLDTSDCDIYGWCIPPKEMVFPHLDGEILGFGRQKKRFEQFQQHHIHDESNGWTYDFQIFNIVKYFDLVMQNNPNLIDSLFVSRQCVMVSTHIGELVRENRKVFLHKGAWPKFKGYSFSQLNSLGVKNPQGKRKDDIDKHGYCTKHAMHLVRLLLEIEQILIEGDLDLMRHKEQLKAIRRGEWTKEQLVGYFDSKERELETVYTNSKLPWGPDEPRIKQILIDCLEMHYGNLEKYVVIPDIATKTIKEIQESIERYKGATQ